MTVSSALAACWALLWCFTIFVSALGWGALVAKLLPLRRSGCTTSCIAGLCFFCVLGGWLNLAHLLRPGLLIALVVAGVGLWLLQLARRRTGKTWRRGALLGLSGASLAALIALVLLFAFRYASTVHRTNYQGVDDYEAYLLFPTKMLQLHYWGADPFNERRLQSSLGPPYFLQALLLSALPLETTQMLDQGVGLLLLLAASLELPALFDFGRRRALVYFFALVAIAMPHIRFNLTMTTLPAGVFMAAAVFMARVTRTRGSTLPEALLIGGCAALIIGCKSTYVPHVFFLCLFFYALLLRSRPAVTVFKAALATSAVCVFVLLPWAIGMRSAEGTFFYPLFGHGYDYTRYYHLAPIAGFRSPREVLKLAALVWILLLCAAGAMALLRRDRQAAVPLSLTGAALFGTVVTGYLAGGDSLRRYNYPCILPALLVTFALALRYRHDSEAWKRALAPAMLFLLLLSGYSMLRWHNIYPEMWRDLRASFRPWAIAPTGSQAAYAALESSLPRAGTTIETLDYPFLLNFRDRNILSADFPACASLPPGWPIKGAGGASGEALAEYLQAHGIRYLAYSYKDEAFLSDAEDASTQTDKASTQPWRNITALILAGHKQYEQLAQTRRHIFDDGQNYVLDLGTRSRGAEAELPAKAATGKE